MVRDPRATVHDRKALPWCEEKSDCNDPERLCADLLSDYESAQELISKYPTRVTAVRYEEFALHTLKVSSDILEFYGLFLQEDVGQFILARKQKVSTPFSWAQQMDFTEVCLL